MQFSPANRRPPLAAGVPSQIGRRPARRSGELNARSLLPSRSSSPLWLLALILIALALRALRLNFQPLWWDEGYSVWFANQPLAEMVELTALDIHPPLYYALLGGWSRLFGLAPAALRLLSVAVGVLTAPLIYAVGRRLAGRPAGLLAALLLTISPLHVFYSQEVRMYALVALWGLLALAFAACWLGLGIGKEPPRGEPAALRSLAGYVIAMTLALYTQYYAAFLAIGLTIAGLLALWCPGWAAQTSSAARRTALWLAAQGTVVLLYLPWLLYAAPRLAPYISQKVAADSDRPLQLVDYLARHLAAFAAGHLEGPLAAWWPVGLLGLLPLAWGLQRLLRASPSRQRHDALSLARFLLIALLAILALGWLVNLTFPFFPERGERLLLLALPLFLLLAAVLATAAATRPAGLLLTFSTLAALSLAAFYATPRYPGEDYRPLIGQVTQWGRPQDTVLCVFPWQVGYFWSYGVPAGPQPLLVTGAEQNQASAATEAELARQADSILAQGRLWFPEHLSLGGLLEETVEAHLAQTAYRLANRWYSPSTRLTGWATPPAGYSRQRAGPVRFAGGLTLAGAEFGPPTLAAANEALLLDLRWPAETPAEERHIGLRLVGPDGLAWAQHDYAALAGDEQAHIGLLTPSGTPPGRYALHLSVSAGASDTPLAALDSAGRPLGAEAILGQIEVRTPDTPPGVETLPLQHSRPVELGDEVRFLGYSAGAGPLAPGGDLALSLFWQALSGPGRSAAEKSAPAVERFAFVQLLPASGRGEAAAWEGPPVAWHPVAHWRAGELVRSQHSLRLPATLADGRYRLIAGLFDPAGGRRLAAPAGDDFVFLDWFQVVGRAHVMTPPQPQYELPVELARLGRLAGYDLSAVTAGPGQTLDLTLHWQATETTSERLVVFVHLLAAEGAFVGQADSEPGNGAWPTSSWTPGEYLADRHRLTVNVEAQPDGECTSFPATLSIGLYDPASQQRLLWLDAAGRPAGDALTLPTTIHIRPC